MLACRLTWPEYIDEIESYQCCSEEGQYKTHLEGTSSQSSTVTCCAHGIFGD